MSLLHADLDDSVYFDEMPQRAEMAAALTDPRARRTRTLFGRAEASEVLREMMAPWIQDLGLTVEACSPAGAALAIASERTASASREHTIGSSADGVCRYSHGHSDPGSLWRAA
jgi:hypothetical protein